MKWKSIGLKLTAAAMTAAMGLHMTMQPLQASAAATQYLSEVIISYGRTDDEAKNWLTQNGYKVVNQNLNEGGEGGSDAFSWLGLASEKRSVYLGYKTTTNADEAITDMKIMNMNGGYSYEAYEKVLKELEQEKAHFLENIMAALKEYRENYAKPEGTPGKMKAQIAHDALNKFKDDDSGALMGDLLLNTIRTEDEAAWQADPTKHADMVTILMQGNSTCVSEIMQNLAIAADTADNSWLNRVLGDQGIPETDETEPDETEDEGETENESPQDAEPAQTAETSDPAEAAQTKFDAFFAACQAKQPQLNKDEIVAELISEYDDDAKKFASSLVGLQNLLDNYTKSGLTIIATDEEADAYFEAHEFEDRRIWMTAANLFYTLKELHYGDDSLLNYLVYTDDDYLANDALLKDYEALGLPQRAKLYPFVAAMSKGQRCLLEYTAMDRMVTMGLTDTASLKSIAATMNDSELHAEQLEVCSVYANVNRDDFKVGEIAVTNVAQGKQASTGEQVNEGLLGVGISPLTAGLGIGGIVMTVAGIAVAVKSGAAMAAYTSIANNAAEQAALDAANGAVYRTVQNGQSILQGGFAQNVLLVTEKGRSYDSVQAMIKAINEVDMGFKTYTEFYTQGHMSMDWLKKNIEQYMHDGGRLTCAGSNQSVIFDAGVKLNYKEGTQDLESITTGTGKVYYMDGRVGVDETVYNNYLKFVANTNQDFTEQINAVTNQLDDMAVSVGFSSGAEYLQQADDAVESINLLLNQTTSGGKTIGMTYYEEWKYMEGRILITQADDIEMFTPRDIIRFKEYLKTKDGDDHKALLKKLEDYEAKQYAKARSLSNNRRELEKLEAYAGDTTLETRENLAEKADDAMSAASGSTFWKWFGVGMAIIGLAMSVYSAYAAITEMQAYYHQEMLPIPRKMVDLGYYDDGTHCYIYYDCTKCNRAAMNMGNETLGDYGDLNGDVMKQWLALYTTKDKRAGSPIQAGFTVKKGTTNIPVRTVPLSFFGFDYAVNMTDTRFTYNNAKNGIYLYYKQIASKYTGTVTTANAYVAVGTVSALLGAGVGSLITVLIGKRKKKEEPTGEPTAA